MDWPNRLNQSLDYIEDNLTGEIDPARCAQIAACSVYHYQRIFPYLTGMSLAEYIRRRRMSAAALELATGTWKIIDLAARYGYESPTAFNRAFQSVHGMPPSAARGAGVRLTAFPRLTFTLSVKGDTAMNYQIVKRDAFRIVGRAIREPMTMEDCFEKIPRFWEEVSASGDLPRICALMDGSGPQGLLGVSACDGGAFSGYFIAVATGREAPEGLDVYRVPAGTWAVFPCAGPMPGAMQALQQRILSEWLPGSGYEYAPAPDIEVYHEGDQSAADYRSEVWLPIVKK